MQAANRPQPTKLSLVCNQFKMTPTQPIYKYALTQTATPSPELKEALKDYFPSFTVKNVLYSMQIKETLETDKFSIVPVGPLDNPTEFLNLLGRKFKRAQ